MSVYDDNRAALRRELRIWGLIPALAREMRAAGVSFPWSTANVIAEAFVDGVDPESW